MKIQSVCSIIILCLIPKLIFAQGIGISKDEAFEIVQSLYQTKNVDYFLCDEYTEGWKFFVDEIPGANWAHNCATYTFPDTIHITAAQTPIKQMLRMPPNERLIPLQMTNEIQSRSIEFPIVLPSSSIEIDSIAAQRTYAVILSGGASMSSNHHRFWNDCSFIYQTLVKRYGIPHSHIDVVMSDGTDPNEDLSLGNGAYISSPLDLDGDGICDIDYAATFANVKSVFQALRENLSRDDHLFVYVMDHGDIYDHNGGSYICLWNSESLTDATLSDWLLPIVQKSVNVNVVLGQCFSGGFIDDLEMVGCVVATACGANELSYAHTNGPQNTHYDYDEFVYHWTSAINGAYPDRYKAYADVDGNGWISMQEAFQYAIRQNNQPATPQYSSIPSSIGEDLAFNKLPQALDVYIKDSVDDSGMENGGIVDCFWQSPSVWLRNDDDNIEGHQNVYYNENDTVSFVYVKVHNRGRDNYVGGSKWIHVNWALASTAASAMAWKGEELFEDIPTGGYLQPVAIPAIVSGDSCTVKVPWELPVAQMHLDSNSERHHLNVVARILDTSNIEPYAPTMPNTFGIKDKNNYAQKSVAYIVGTQLAKSAKVFMRNIENTEQTYSLEIMPHAMKDTILFNKANVELTLSSSLLSAWQSGGCVGSHISYEPTEEPLKISLNSAYSSLYNIRMEPNQLSLMSLKFDFHTPSPRGLTYDIDLIQRDESGQIIGGQTYIVEAPIGILIKPEIIGPVGPGIPIVGGQITLGADLDGTEQLIVWTDENGKHIGHSLSVNVSPTPDNNTYHLRVLTAEGELSNEGVTLDPTIGIKSVTQSSKHANAVVIEFFSETFEVDSYVILHSVNQYASPVQYPVPVGINSLEIDLAELPSGIYSVSYIINDQIVDAIKFSK